MPPRKSSARRKSPRKSSAKKQQVVDVAVDEPVDEPADVDVAEPAGDISEARDSSPSSGASSIPHQEEKRKRTESVGEKSGAPFPGRLSRDSSPSSGVSLTSQVAGKKRKPRKKPRLFKVEQEDEMLEFLTDNPMLWNLKLTDYRRKDKKERIWEEQAQKMGKTPDELKAWFRSVRDTHTRLHKGKKSGDGVLNLTERENWIKTKFAFLRNITRHRPEPLKTITSSQQPEPVPTVSTNIVPTCTYEILH